MIVCVFLFLLGWWSLVEGFWVRRVGRVKECVGSEIGGDSESCVQRGVGEVGVRGVCAVERDGCGNGSCGGDHWGGSGFGFV